MKEYNKIYLKRKPFEKFIKNEKNSVFKFALLNISLNNIQHRNSPNYKKDNNEENIIMIININPFDEIEKKYKCEKIY
jgi:hypothetical protein